MKKNLKSIVPLSVAALALGGVMVMSSPAQAQEQGEERQNILVTKLVERFGLNQSEVEDVVAEVREEKREQKQQRFNEKLDALVENGDLTADQKNLITAKKDELRSEREVMKESMGDLSREERKELKEQKREEMQQWAQDNGIDLEILKKNKGGRGGQR